MDKIVDIPVKDPRGKLIGKASITNENDGYYAHIVLNPELADEMMKAMAIGMVTGLSVGPEISPVMRKPANEGGVILVDAVSANPSLNERLRDVGIEMFSDYKVEGYFEIKQPPPPGQLGDDEIEHRFGFHKATIEGPNATVPMHAAVRKEFMNFAKWLDKNSPGNREKLNAFDRLEESSMWFHKSIAKLARNPDEEV